MTAVDMFRGSAQRCRGNELLAMRYSRQDGGVENMSRMDGASLPSTQRVGEALQVEMCTTEVRQCSHVRGDKSHPPHCRRRIAR